MSKTKGAAEKAYVDAKKGLEARAKELETSLETIDSELDALKEKKAETKGEIRKVEGAIQAIGVILGETPQKKPRSSKTAAKRALSSALSGRSKTSNLSGTPVRGTYREKIVGFLSGQSGEWFSPSEISDRLDLERNYTISTLKKLVEAEFVQNKRAGSSSLYCVPRAKMTLPASTADKSVEEQVVAAAESAMEEDRYYTGAGVISAMVAARLIPEGVGSAQAGQVAAILKKSGRFVVRGSGSGQMMTFKRKD